MGLPCYLVSPSLSLPRSTVIKKLSIRFSTRSYQLVLDVKLSSRTTILLLNGFLPQADPNHEPFPLQLE